MFPVDKKASRRKKVYHKNVLIRWYPISYLTIASYGFFGALTGPYPTLRFGGACGLGVGAFYQEDNFACYNWLGKQEHVCSSQESEGIIA